MPRLRLLPAACALAALIALPFPAFGQTASTIVGVVTDESGGALPGVTVEVSSPALIGGTQTLVSDVDGNYRVIDLRPGSYTLVFSLSGFQTLRREGITLTAAFTARVNVTLKVSGVQETVTVTGAAPLVDTSSSVSQTVITQELKDNIPSGRSMGAIVGLAPGIVTSNTTGVDVAGTRALLNVSVAVHGSNGGDTTWNFQGLDITSAIGAGNPAGYYNDGLLEEAAVLTQALPAEIGGGGVFVNFIPKAGGNTFHGSMFANGTNADLQGDNLTPELIAQGQKAPTRINKMYDVNPGVGGPILHDRLWFYASARRQIVQLKLANQFNADGTQVIDKNQNANASFSVLAQVSTGNRLSFMYDRAWKVNLTSQTGAGQCANFPTIVDISATTKQPTYPRIGSLKWTSVLSNRMTLEAGVSVMDAHYNFEHGPFAGNEVTKIDLGLGKVSGSDSCETFVYPLRRNVQAVAQYVPSWHGVHNIRVGTQMQWNHYNLTGPSNGRGDWAWQYRNGSPTSVVVFNLPYAQENYWKEYGWFVQDSWEIKRLTLNLGARFEYFNGYIPAQTAPAGNWVPERNYPRQDDIPNWFTVVPRVAIVYDLFGNGKTALKANVSKYESRQAGFMRAVNPTSRGNSTRSWTDDNNDLIPQLSELGAGTPFTGGTNTRYAPGIDRPYQWEYTVSLQQQLLPSVGLTVAYYRRQNYALIGSKNILVPPSSYIPVTVNNPLTNEPMTVFNQNPATSTLVDTVMDNYPEIENYYNGVEFVLNKRFSKNLTVLTGFTIGANKGTISTTSLNNPNTLINNEGYIGNDSTYILNLLGTYRMPRDFMASVHWYDRSGYPLQRTFTFTRTQVPNLTQVTQSVSLLPRGEFRRGALGLLDMRFSKAFRFTDSLRIEPLVEVYNILNNNSSITESEVVGPNLGFVTESVTARVAKLGVKVTF